MQYGKATTVRLLKFGDYLLCQTSLYENLMVIEAAWNLPKASAARLLSADGPRADYALPVSVYLPIFNEH